MSGHGLTVGHVRWRYAVSRDEINADGLADFSTQCSLVASIAASSLTRCGLLPVFSICCMVPTTISSLMPSVSILLLPSVTGEGGGDNSVARRGRSSLQRIDVVRGGLISPKVGDVEPCDRFGFFTGGSSPSITVSGGVGAWVRDRFAATIPRSPRFRLLRRVCIVSIGSNGRSMRQRNRWS